MTSTLTRPAIKEATPDINFCNCCGQNEATNETGTTYYEIDFNHMGVYLCKNCLDILQGRGA